MNPSKKLKVPFLLSLFAALLFWEVFNGVNAQAAKLDCLSLKNCVEDLAMLKNQKILTQESLEVKNFPKLSIEGSVEELDQALSFVLHQNGFTRIQGQHNQVYVVLSRDIRYLPTTLISQEKVESVPSTYDYFMVEYKMKNKFLAEYAVSSLRPFMSRYGRVIHNKVIGQIVLQDTGANIHRLMTLIKEFDVELTKEEKKEVERSQSHARKLQLLRAQRGDSKSP